MFNQCWQIFLTYLRRRLFWLFALMFLFGWVMLLMGIFGKRQGGIFNSDMPHLMFGFFFYYFFGGVVYHLKQQIAVPHASTIPGYRVPHLVVAFLLTLPVLVAAPVMTSMGLGLPIWPLLSLNVAFCALMTWAVYRNSGAAMVLAVGCWLAPAAPAVHTLFLDRFITDHSLRNSLAALPLLALGAAGLALTTRRLLALREHMPEYPRNIGTNPLPFSKNYNGMGAARQVNWDSWWFRWAFAPNERQLSGRGWTGPSNAGFWRRVAHRRAAYTNRRMAIPVALMFVIMFTVWVGLSSHDAPNFAGPILYLIPAYVTFVQQYGRWPMLGYESLRPVTRRDFVLENAAALAWHQTEMWVTMAVAFAAVAAMTAPELLIRGDLWKILAVSATAQMLTVPMVWWLLRVRSPAILLGMAMVGGLCFAPFAVFTRDILPKSPIWAAVGITAALLVGTLIALDAYRRWLRADLA